MKKNKNIPTLINCCPLCKGDEYFISESGENFTCGLCGFHTEHLSSVRSVMLGETSPPFAYIYPSDNTIH